MKKFILKDLSDSEISRLCKRPKMDFASVYNIVEPIIEAVKNEGDHAVHAYTKKFDGTDTDQLFIKPDSLVVNLSREEKQAIDMAMRNVQRFHIEQMAGNLVVETMPGITCMKYLRPIEKVGLYIPGGSAPLPSTAIMLGVPAKIAGCESIIIATPPDKHGKIPDSIAYIARSIGVAGIVKAGGAQAIAAMAYGTESVPKVDKIFGPGNQYVTVAKMALQNSDALISIDLPAGPSEVLIIADKNSDPDFIAADLLSQAEHGSDSQVILTTLKGVDIEAVEKSIDNQILSLPRAEIARGALDNSFIIQVNNPDQAIAFSNRYAPEHLILHIDNPSLYIDHIKHAGSVFLGSYTPESLGDYASGTNHTLPTFGYARMYSGVSLSSFQKSITFQHASKEGLEALGPTVEKLAEMEGLEAHKNAVSVRLNKLATNEVSKKNEK